MGVAVDGLCHPAQACRGTNGVRSPVLPQQSFSLSGAGQMINVCACPGFPLVSPVSALPFYKGSSLSAFFHPLSAYRS